MGHDSERATLIYQHSSSQRQRALADEVGKMASTELAKVKAAKPSGTRTARKPGEAGDFADGASPELGK